MVEKHENNIYTFYTRKCCNNLHASEICKKFDGILTPIKSASVQAFINERIDINGGGNYWIGLYQIGDDTTKWEWSDKETVDYTNWWYSEPNNINEKCAEVRNFWSYGWNYQRDYYLRWNDRDCSIINKFICENSKLLATILITSQKIDFNDNKYLKKLV